MPLGPLPDPDRFLPRLWGLFLAVLTVAVLFSTLLMVNVIQMTTLLLWPFSRKAFQEANRAIAYAWITLTIFWGTRILGFRLTLSGDDVPASENAIVVSNHQEMPDIHISWLLARRKGRAGDVKYFAKDSLKYIPGLGWGMLFINCIFVKRNWTRDRDTIRQTFQKVLSHRTPLWLILYAEGTRFKPEKLARSRKFAERQGLKPTRHIMPPRTRGFVATVIGLRDHAQAVYDFTIGYKVGVPTLWQYAHGYATELHLHVRRYPIGELPREDEEIADWLFRLYEEKDQLLEYYYQHGAFPS